MNIKPVISSTGNLKESNPQENQDRRLKKACKQFEGIFIASMLKESFNTSETQGDKKGKKPFKAMEEVALERTGQALVSDDGEGFGLWKVLYDRLSVKNSASEEQNEPELPAEEIKKEGDPE